jgi:hypothetical protein
MYEGLFVLHLQDAADRCAARHYWVRQASNALQCANARQLHHLAADCQGRNATSVAGARAPPVDIHQLE